MKVHKLLNNVKQVERAEAEILLAHVLRCERVKLIVDSDLVVGKRQKEEFEKLVVRRAAGEPVAHLTGSKEFYGLGFAVNSKVLIPRPETEQIVEEVLSFIKASPQAREVLDIGTGSGCIAVAIAKSLPDMRVAACDVSSEALKVARENAERHKVEIELYESDLLDSVPSEYDIVVANLPYIADSDPTVESGVKQYEPHLALYSGTDGLDLYRRLFQQLGEWQMRPRLLLIEIGWQQREALIQLVEQYLPDSRVECLQDLAGHDRIIKIVNTITRDSSPACAGSE